MASWKIVESELIEWLKSYGGPRYHAVLSDPPYALISITKRFGKAGSAPAQEGSDGRYSRLSKGFMGQKWDGFESLEHYQKWVSEWSELMIQRLLYPGAVCLFFGGTRTFHHLGVGLENGGFEIVDSILIPWIHGQGFPKSHDISKGLDKAAGAEREVIGKNPNKRQDHKKGSRGFDSSLGKEELEEMNISAPATPEAETWDGYGTSLKPAWEPVFVCRVPRGDKTFTQLAIEFGTGALNIDKSRIGKTEMKVTKSDGTILSENTSMAGHNTGRIDVGTKMGRWPANFALSHHEDCVLAGEMLQPAKEIRENTEGTEGSFGLGSRRKPKSHYRIKGRQINRFKQGMMPFGGAEGEEYEIEEMPDELVERWACVRECPVRVLDDQAGDRTSARVSGNPNSPKRGGATVPLWGMSDGKETWDYRDSGGPSRFFYTAKAGRSEKDKGLERFWWKRTDEGFERIKQEEYEKLGKRERAHGCIHPTVKPLELLRYLSTLLLPPKQEGRIRRILIPFSGIGSEMIGAYQAGWDEVLGIEMESNYAMMAEAHIRATIGMF